MVQSRHVATAVGIVMHEHDVSSGEAFGLLSAESRTQRVTLHELAEDVVRNGRLG